MEQLSVIISVAGVVSNLFLVGAFGGMIYQRFKSIEKQVSNGLHTDIKETLSRVGKIESHLCGIEERCATRGSMISDLFTRVHQVETKDNSCVR